MTVKDSRMSTLEAVDLFVGVSIPHGVGIIAHHTQGDKNKLVDAGTLTQVECQPLTHYIGQMQGLMEHYCKENDAYLDKVVFCAERVSYIVPQKDLAEAFRLQEVFGYWRTLAICAMKWEGIDEDETHNGVGRSRWRRELYGKGKGRPKSQSAWDFWSRGHVAATYGKTIDAKEQAAVNAVCVAAWAESQYARARKIEREAKQDK